MPSSGFETNRYGVSNSSHCCNPNIWPHDVGGESKAWGRGGVQKRSWKAEGLGFLPFYRLGSQSVTNRDPCPHQSPGPERPGQQMSHRGADRDEGNNTIRVWRELASVRPLPSVLAPLLTFPFSFGTGAGCTVCGMTRSWCPRVWLRF